MGKLGFILLLTLLCCTNAKDSIMARDYSVQHQQALQFCKDNHFNEEYYFLIDMSIHSGKNRFFIYDFDQHKITNQKLVTHGSCDQLSANPDKWEKVRFNPKNDSHCSMKGKYAIGNRDYSSWGIKVKYWLNGLERSNSTAVKRVVVLHSWDAVSDTEVFPDYSPLSWGCPAVSNEFMTKIDALLKKNKKPVLLWIID